MRMDQGQGGQGERLWEQNLSLRVHELISQEIKVQSRRPVLAFQYPNAEMRFPLVEFLFSLLNSLLLGLCQRFGKILPVICHIHLTSHDTGRYIDCGITTSMV